MPGRAAVRSLSCDGGRLARRKSIPAASLSRRQPSVGRSQSGMMNGTTQSPRPKDPPSEGMSGGAGSKQTNISSKLSTRPITKPMVPLSSRKSLQQMQQPRSLQVPVGRGVRPAESVKPSPFSSRGSTGSLPMSPATSTRSCGGGAASLPMSPATSMRSSLPGSLRAQPAMPLKLDRVPSPCRTPSTTTKTANTPATEPPASAAPKGRDESQRRGETDRIAGSLEARQQAPKQQQQQQPPQPRRRMSMPLPVKLSAQIEAALKENQGQEDGSSSDGELMPHSLSWAGPPVQVDEGGSPIGNLMNRALERSWILLEGLKDFRPPPSDGEEAMQSKESQGGSSEEDAAGVVSKKAWFEKTGVQSTSTTASYTHSRSNSGKSGDHESEDAAFSDISEPEHEGNLDDCPWMEDDSLFAMRAEESSHEDDYSSSSLMMDELPFEGMTAKKSSARQCEMAVQCDFSPKASPEAAPPRSLLSERSVSESGSGRGTQSERVSINKSTGTAVSRRLSVPAPCCCPQQLVRKAHSITIGPQILPPTSPTPSTRLIPSAMSAVPPLQRAPSPQWQQQVPQLARAAVAPSTVSQVIPATPPAQSPRLVKRTITITSTYM